MILRTFLAILMGLTFCSCFQKNKKAEQQSEHNLNHMPVAKSGLKIESGPNQGIRANASQGITNPFIYTTSIITNDSTIPIHFHAELSNDDKFPSFCNDSNSTYKAILFPKELTPVTATLRNSLFEPDDLLSLFLDGPYIFDKTLKPGENCIITIGVEYPGSSNCEVVPRVLFSHDSRGLYQDCYVRENHAISSKPLLEIGVKLEFYKQRKFIAPEDACAVIPLGQISYP